MNKEAKEDEKAIDTDIRLLQHISIDKCKNKCQAFPIKMTDDSYFCLSCPFFLSYCLNNMLNATDQQIILMSQENTFFATQIAQQSVDHPQEQQEVESPEVVATVEPSKQQQDIHSLRHLLTAFNSFDKEEKGLIRLEDVSAILTSKGISTQNVKEYHLMSLPLFENLVSFDEFLFIYALSENTSENVEEKYALCKKVDERLIDFLKLLNNYRKKCEKNGNYKEAKNSKKKIQEIRERQLGRRNKYLRILYDNEISQTEKKQKAKFQEFCREWDEFMNNYEATATDLLKKVKERQQADIQEYEEKTKEELAAKMHYSKYLLELQLKEKNLVKIQEYEKAANVQLQIEQVKIKQIREKQLADLEVIQLRLKAFRKQQESAVSTLLQKLQKDRNDHLKQRQNETQKIMVRSKSQLTEIDHRFNQTVKRIYEALHNMGLESQKNIKSKK